MEGIETENKSCSPDGIKLLNQLREQLGMRTDEFLRIPETSFSDIKWTVEAINKREIGRFLLKLVGNEGKKDDHEKAPTRRLLQEIIDFYPNEQPYVWENAKITIIDIKCNTITIQSGKGLHRFLVKYGKNGQTHLHKFYEGRFVDLKYKIVHTTKSYIGTPLFKTENTSAISATNTVLEKESSAFPFNFFIQMFKIVFKVFLSVFKLFCKNR